MKTLISIFIICTVIFSCVSNKNLTNIHNYKTVKIGNQVWMQENLKLTSEKWKTLCYNDSIEYCEQGGVLYNWKDVNQVCPKGWHLPTTKEVIEFYKNLPGEINANHGRTINKETLDYLNVNFVGYKITDKGTPKFIGKGIQEIWLVNTDSVWVDPTNAEHKLNMVGIHFYPIRKDKFNTEATLTNPGDIDGVYANCRCIKNSN